MSEQHDPFDHLRDVLAAEGVAAVLEQLEHQLREQQRYHELFEALKMKVRHSLGLPLLYSDSGDELDEGVRTQLEDGLIDACREVGMLLLEQGNIRQGWTYLRPVGDRAAAAGVLSRFEPNDENLEELVEVSLYEGVDPVRGFQLVLQHYGTCNAITTFESAMPGRPRAQQQGAAALLAQHVHHELLASVRADIARQEGREPTGTTLAELVADRDWLFGEHSYHIDTTHLAATVRFARMLEDEKVLRLALDMTEYGRRLSAQFQYRGDEPFADIYPSHRLFFQALLGEDVPAAVDYFRERAERLDTSEHGTAAIEVYVDLLARIGRPDEALKASIRLMPPDLRPMGHAPSLLELSQQAGSYQPLLDYCRQRNDLLGFATGLVCSAAAP